ncbi:MAG: tetratricopeptide repeat protein [Candidatus Rokubacteria bacterium]|nr:tetratricopeptide repeat protein [Candidatus Rokubacteria bacterium]
MIDSLLDLGRSLSRIFGGATTSPKEDPEAAELARRAAEAHQAGRRDEARRLYRQALRVSPQSLAALRGLRTVALEGGDWPEALGVAERVAGLVAGAERAAEAEWVAAAHFELGRAAAAGRRTSAAIAHFRSALKADRAFVPAALALGDAHEAAGEHKEAVRVWEKALEVTPALPLLERLERAFRDEGRPRRMIALYQSAVSRAPEDLALAVALGRVYFELEMLDEAADQFEKVEVRAPDLPVVHAYLGAVFEHRGQARDAFEEYRRALRLEHAFEWPQACRVCAGRTPTWQDRCPHCGRWNALRPADG